MMIALPNPDRSFTCTLFWPKSGLRGARLARRRRDRGVLRRALPRRRRADARPWRRTTWPTRWARWSPCGAGRGSRRPGRAGRRRRARDRAVLRPGRELRVRGLRRARPLPRRARAATGRRALAALPGAAQAQRRRHRRHGAGELRRDARQGRLPGVPGPRRGCGTRWSARCGGRYVSRYELVSFTTIPYAEIDGRIRRQDRTVGAVAAGMLAAVGAGALLLRRRR